MCYNFCMKKINFNLGPSQLADGAVFIILGLVPVFFNYFYPTSIDLSKIVLFKIFTLLLLFAVVWRLAGFKINLLKKSLKGVLPVGFLFVFLVLSLFFSVDITTSWFGSFDRQEGLISWLFYGLWAVLLVIHLNHDDNLALINRFLIVSSISGFIVSVYALLQIVGLDFISWSEPASATGRAVSFIGQPNYLACWLVIVLPFSAYLFFIKKGNPVRFVWLGVFILELLALFATGSRSTFFIFLLISVIWLLGFLVLEKRLSVKKIWAITIFSLLIFAAFLTFLANTQKTRFTELMDFKKGSLAVRLDLWQTGLKSFSQKPWFGYGLENQKEIYVSYYKTDFALFAKPNTYSDRAHNLILDILLTTGIFGLLFFGYFLYSVFNNLFKALDNKKYKSLAIFLIWSLSAYLFSLLFNFSVTVTNIYFWFMVALSFVITDKKFFIIKNEKAIFDLAKIILVSGVALLFLYGSYLEIRKLETDYYYNRALSEINNSQYFTALVFVDYLNWNYPNPVFLARYNQGISLRFLETLPNIKEKPAIFAIKNYLTTSEKTLSSHNFENNFVRAFILGATGKRYESEELFAKLSLISPELPKIYLAWGDILMFNRDYKNAIIKFDQVSSLLPGLDNLELNNDQRKHLNFYRQQIQIRILAAKELLK